jgi:hypothetical protein
LESGFFIPGNAKALIKLRGPGGKAVVAASQNRGKVKLFTENNPQQKIITLRSDDKAVLITFADGHTRKEELQQGSSFLSQSSRFIDVNASVKNVVIINSKGEKRTVQ